MDAADIKKIANLARLEVNQETAERTATSITEVLALVEQLADIDTDNVEPMAHPLDATQVLRADTISETNERDKFQAIAPATEDGLYLVPKVID